MSSPSATISFSQLLGDLYARWTLDSVVEVAYGVSRDFVVRPEFYKGGTVAEGIVNLRMEYGTKAGFPNQT